MPETIKILFLAANPQNQNPLRLGEEAREIREKIRLATERDRFSYEDRWAVRVPDLTQVMLDIKPTIAHFSGHGSGKKGLYFENPVSGSQLVPAKALSALFARFNKTLRCVVLNACYSEEQAQAISQHVDYVVGMNEKIDDKASVAFSVGFYQALGAGEAVEEAFELGKVQILLLGLPDDEVPVLRVRDGVATNQSLLVSSASATSAGDGGIDAEKLIEFLNGLTPADLGQILLRLPETTGYVPDSGAHLRRVEALILFMNSTGGHGLTKLAQVVQKRFPNAGPFI